MEHSIQPTCRSTREALALWRDEGGRTANDLEIAAYMDDANAFAREELARDWRTEPMITRATVDLPTAFVGIRMFDAETGQCIGAHYRSAPEQMQPCGRAALNLLTNRNTFSRMLGKNVAAWTERPLDRFGRRRSEHPGVLDILVFGGVARPASGPAEAGPFRSS